MLAVLLVSIAAAELVVSASRSRARGGERILAEIRSRGLAAYWGTKPVDIWLIGRDSQGRAVSWRHIKRTPDRAGYRGMREEGGKAGQFVTELWRLNADATAGRYESTSAAKLGQGDATISLDSGKVTVWLPARPIVKATSAAPANYIPEGLDLLVWYLAAGGGRQVSCQMIFNERAVAAGQVRFSPVRLIPKGPTTIAVRSGAIPGPVLYQFDNKGLPETITELGGKIVYNRATQRELIAEFPVLSRSLWPGRIFAPTLGRRLHRPGNRDKSAPPSP